MKQHAIWIDILKGVAIILVVVGHNATQNITDFIFCFHMPLFFLLSGFTFSPKPIKQYIHKSTKRLLVPYIFFFVVISLPQLWTMYIEKNVLGGGKANAKYGIWRFYIDWNI